MAQGRELDLPSGWFLRNTSGRQGGARQEVEASLKRVPENQKVGALIQLVLVKIECNLYMM